MPSHYGGGSSGGGGGTFTGGTVPNATTFDSAVTFRGDALLPGSIDESDVLTVVAGDNTADRTLALTAGANLVLDLDAGAFEFADTIQTKFGTSNSPSIAFGSGGPSIWASGNSILVNRATSLNLMVIDGSATLGGPRLGVDGIFSWSNFPSPDQGGKDTALARAGAATVRASDASAAGLGYLLAGQVVVANTTTVAPTLAASGTLYTNTGDTDGSSITLPNDPTIGTTFQAFANADQPITINVSAGETIRDGVSSGTSIASSTQGAWIRLVAVTGGSGAVWGVCGKLGTWTTA